MCSPIQMFHSCSGAALLCILFRSRQQKKQLGQMDVTDLPGFLWKIINWLIIELCTKHDVYFLFICDKLLQEVIRFKQYQGDVVFLCLSDLDFFSLDERGTVHVKEGQGAVLLCAPPPHYPGTVYEGLVCVFCWSVCTTLHFSPLIIWFLSRFLI